jgi:hypothetical protein
MEHAKRTVCAGCTRLQLQLRDACSILADPESTVEDRRVAYERVDVLIAEVKCHRCEDSLIQDDPKTEVVPVSYFEGG